MLEGERGKGVSMAMEILTAVGDSFHAPRLVPVSRAHISLDGQEADLWFTEKMRQAGAVCTVPTTVNPGYCPEFFQQRGLLAPGAAEHMGRIHRAYEKLGATLTYSCTPYLFGNIPHFGEVVAFSETSVSIYANAVLGARTNRESLASAMCSAITGLTPEYGMLLPENRRGNILVHVEAEMADPFDYALLGLMGKELGKGVPVFLGLPEHIPTEGFIQLGAELNVSGMFEMFHIPGVTPEAPTLEAATGGAAPIREVTVTRRALEETRQRFSPAVGEKLDYVILGCPHYDYEQLADVRRKMEGRPAAVPVWVHTSGAVCRLAEETGLAAELDGLGVELVPSTCVDQSRCWGSLAGKCGLTDSPKASYYMRTFGVKMAIRDRGTCLRAAQRGVVEP